MRPIRDGERERSVLAKLDDRHRAHRTVEAIAEAADVHAEEYADRHADRRLVRDDQHVPPLVVRALDSMRGRPWVWLFGQERAVAVMQRFAGPGLVVVGSALSVVFLRRLF